MASSAVLTDVSLSVPSGIVMDAMMVLLDMDGIMLMPMLSTPATENTSRPRATMMGRALWRRKKSSERA